jgi:Homing endonuclease associated repeat/Homeodomain-like domain
MAQLVSRGAASGQLRDREGLPRARHWVRRDTWSADGVLAALRAWEVEHGRAPRAYEWSPTLGRSVGLLGRTPSRWEREYPRWPSYATVCRHHGSWRGALLAAGLSAPPALTIALAERVRIAQRLAADGLAVSTIADMLGVHRSTVRGYLRAGACPICGAVKVRADARTCRRCRKTHTWWPAFGDQQILDSITRWTERFGQPPRKTQWRPTALGGHPAWEAEHPRWPPPSIVIRRFGSWHAALARAGVAAAEWTPADMLDALRRFNAERGRPPAARDWRQTSDEHPSFSMVIDAFGSWAAGLHRAGLQPAQHSPWTPAEILDALHALRDQLGRPPRARDLHSGEHPVPGYSTVRRHFGSLNRALREADRRLAPRFAKTADRSSQRPQRRADAPPLSLDPPRR